MTKKTRKVKPAAKSEGIEKMEDVPLLTVAEAAERLGVRYLTAWKYVRDGVFPHAFQLPGGHYRIPETDVELIKQQRSQDTS